MEGEGTEDVTVDSEELSDVVTSASEEVDEYSDVGVSVKLSVVVVSDEDTLSEVDSNVELSVSEYVIVDGSVDVKSDDSSVDDSTVEDIVAGSFEDVSVLEIVFSVEVENAEDVSVDSE